MFSSDLRIHAPELLINDGLLLQMNLDSEVSEGEDGHSRKRKKNKHKGTRYCGAAYRCSRARSWGAATCSSPHKPGAVSRACLEPA